jgi:hypothetical protein
MPALLPDYAGAAVAVVLAAVFHIASVEALLAVLLVLVSVGMDPTRRRYTPSL